MIFEIYIPKFSIAVGGGGRYDHLIETFHGQSTSAVGCAPGIDRIVLAMKEMGIEADEGKEFLDKICIACIDEQMLPESLEIADKLRGNDFIVDFDLGRKRLRNAISFAVSKKIRYLIIIGPDEIMKGKLTVRDLAYESQSEISIQEIVSYFKEKIKN